MIFRWLIFFSALLIPLYAASVTGRVELRDSKEATVRNKKNFAGVVVSLEVAKGQEPLKISPGRVVMTQKGKTFSPHVLAITAGTTVEFPNFDPIFHSAFSNYNGQVFDLGLYAPGSTRSVRFSRLGAVRIFCNIHDQMSALILVLDTPWFDVSKADGSFKVQNVPPGEYRLHVFHERATPAALNSLTRTITVGADSVTIPTIAISESGYLPIPHRNKYGQDYFPPPSDEGVYPSVRK